MTNDRIKSRGIALVVDDDEVLRKATSRLLRRLGFAVIAATDGPAAIRICAQGPLVVDVIVLDFSMPVMDGAECFHQLRARGFEIPVVLVSGNAPPSVVGELSRAGLAAFLPRPFTSVQLAEVLDRCVAPVAS